MYKLMVRTSFAAAHQLKGYGGKCEALHGHNWKVQLYIVAEELDKTGLAIDFSDLKKGLRSIVQALDHTYLNDLPYFQDCNPSSENIARYLFLKAQEELKETNVKISSVRVWESDDAYAEYS